MNIVLTIVILLLVLLVLYVISTYNKLVGARNKVHDQFSQIDVELKRRFDLVPNLVEIVKGYFKHESETLTSVIEARNSYMTANNDNKKVESANNLSSEISKLFILSERYPELKANTNFMQLQSDLKEVEEKISYARQFYNDTVLMYNNKIEMIPSNIVAFIFGFRKATFFELDEKERENVKVKF